MEMNYYLLKRISFFSAVIMIMVIITSSYFIPDNCSKSHESISGEDGVCEKVVFSDSVDEDCGNVNAAQMFDTMDDTVEWNGITCQKDSIEKLNDKTVVIKKDASGKFMSAAGLKTSDVDRQLTININGISEGEFTENSIIRINGTSLKKYSGMPPTATPTATPFPTITPINSGYGTGRDDVINSLHDQVKEESDDTDLVRDIVISNSKKSLDGTYSCNIVLTFNKTYVYDIFEDEYNYYITMKAPKDVYDKIVVLDAGHGGKDSGAVSRDNNYLEKDFTLQVVIYLKKMLEKNTDIKVYCTRTTDRTLTLIQRVNLANDTDADFFLSVHCNSNISSLMSGTEVLYNARDDKAEMNSKKFASCCLKKLTQTLKLRNLGLISRESTVSVIKYSKVPVALTEIAFISNDRDLDVLKNDSKMKNVAKALYDAILEAYGEEQ